MTEDPVEIPEGTPNVDDPPPSSDPDTRGLPTAGIYYFHPNQVGSTKMLTNSQGELVSRLHYSPFGEVLREHCTGNDVFNRKYTGQTEDLQTGLHYYRSRYYDPALGRFVSADSIIPNAKRTQSFNRYMYVKGNPVKYKDPDGHKWGSGTWNKAARTISNAGSRISSTAGNALRNNFKQIKVKPIKESISKGFKKFNESIIFLHPVYLMGYNFEEGKWTKKEFTNQLIHFGVGFAIAFILVSFGITFWWAIVIVLIIAVLIEMDQYTGFSHNKLGIVNCPPSSRQYFS